MRTRVLAPEEWQDAKVPDLPDMMLLTEPQNVDVVVVEDDEGKVLASVCALRVTHFEGLWIDPSARGNPGVFRALIREAYQVPRDRRETWVFGGAKDGDERMRSLCSGLKGQELPLRFYAMPVGAPHAVV